MKLLQIAAGALVLCAALYAQESCQQMLTFLDKDEKAYENVQRQSSTRGESSAAIGRFIGTAETVMSRCRHVLSFEQRQLLGTKLQKAKGLQSANSMVRPSQPFRDPGGRREHSQGVIKTH